jgi:ribosomal protein L11 methylase PrmA
LAGNGHHVERAKSAKLSKRSFLAMLEQLRHWIESLKPAKSSATTWQNYAENTTYATEERNAKRRVISAFCQTARPGVLWDLGCNTGDYSEAALTAGVKHVIGFDYDQGALEGAVARSKARTLDLLPLYQDGANPSPDQGWRGCERGSAQRRGGANALIALAFEHHLAIGRNVPLAQVVEWLVSLAPKGIIEFVPKSDPTVQKLLALREDIFADYNAVSFEAALSTPARVIAAERVSSSGRTLYSYERR